MGASTFLGTGDGVAVGGTGVGVGGLVGGGVSPALVGAGVAVGTGVAVGSGVGVKGTGV